MLVIEISAMEYYDDKKNEFIEVQPTTIQLEHSLSSLSKWESKYHKPFLEQAAKEMSAAEFIDYVRFMTLNKVPENVYWTLNHKQIEEIRNYIEDPMTATTFQNNGKKSDINAGRKKHEVITAEIIYYWMVELGIPFECENWHINKLMALIKVCSVKNSNHGSGNKMNKKDLMSFNRSLMASRRSKFNKGGH